MARGRARKANVKRTRTGQISRAGVSPWDYGNDRVQQRREAFQVFQGGKANEHINDCIGRVWAVGLLDGTDYDAVLLRDIGREYAALYWGYYPATPGVAQYEPRSRTSGSSSKDPKGEWFVRLDVLALSAGREAREAMHDLCVNEYWFPDDNPGWAQRLLNECMVRKGGAVCGLLPTPADHDRLQLAKAGLVAMIG